MLLIIRKDDDEIPLEVEITKTLHEFHEIIKNHFNLKADKYRFIFNNKFYHYKGDYDTDLFHCDLFVYNESSVNYACGENLITIIHQRKSNDLYDYCDFNNPRYCSVYKKVIESNLCYESLMCLGGTFKIESLPELKAVEDIQGAIKKCRKCLYSICDNIDINGNEIKR